MVFLQTGIPIPNDEGGAAAVRVTVMTMIVILRFFVLEKHHGIEHLLLYFGMNFDFSPSFPLFFLQPQQVHRTP
jgi:hypothetical protein